MQPFMSQMEIDGHEKFHLECGLVGRMWQIVIILTHTLVVTNLQMPCLPTHMQLEFDRTFD